MTVKRIEITKDRTIEDICEEYKDIFYLGIEQDWRGAFALFSEEKPSDDPLPFPNPPILPDEPTDIELMTEYLVSIDFRMAVIELGL